MSLTIVADQNIPLLDHYFGATGDIIKIDGRTLSQAQLINADVLLVRSVTRVNEALLAATPVRFVGSASAGKDHLDTNYLEQTGIAWCHAPGCNADAVADYVLSAFCRTPALLARLFNGALVGIVGIGHVGSCLYRRLQALGMRCIAYDPLIEQNRYPILTDLERVLTADVVCLHAPLTTTGCYPSYHLLDNARLAQLRPGTVLLNAGRGALIDNQALCERLIQHADLTVILDVWEGEPAINTTLMQQIHLATPHIAGHSIEGKLMATAMLYQAYCRAFDLTITRFAPSSRQNVITIDATDPLAGLQQAIISSYDILTDDQAMRLAVKNNATPTAFDQLRSNYPMRHQFSRQRISGDNIGPKLQHDLQAAGFVVEYTQ